MLKEIPINYVDKSNLFLSRLKGITDEKLSVIIIIITIIIIIIELALFYRNGAAICLLLRTNWFVKYIVNHTRLVR